MLTLLAYQATKVNFPFLKSIETLCLNFTIFQINGVNTYAATVIGYLVYALAQVFHFCIFGNRLIEEVNIEFRTFFKVIIVLFYFICLELICNGSSLQLSLVRWIGRSKNFCTNRLSAMSESYVNFGSKVLYHFIGFVCFGKQVMV